MLAASSVLSTESFSLLPLTVSSCSSNISDPQIFHCSYDATMSVACWKLFISVCFQWSEYDSQLLFVTHFFPFLCHMLKLLKLSVSTPDKSSPTLASSLFSSFSFPSHFLLLTNFIYGTMEPVFPELSCYM